MRLKTLGAGVVAAATALVALAGPAVAQGPLRDWGYRQHNLVLSGEGRGHGQWRIEGTSSGTKSHVSALIQDLNVGGDRIYVHLTTQSTSGYCFVPNYTSCTQDFSDGPTANTGRSNAGYFVRVDAYGPIDQNAKFMRAKIQVCRDRRFWPDPCKGPYITAPDPAA